MGSFAGDYKSAPRYLDVAANGNGDEKAFLTAAALNRLNDPEVHLVEIGPGGGAAIDSLTGQINPSTSPTINLSLVEVESVSSPSLSAARERFTNAGLGTTALHAADARELLKCFGPNSADVIAGSAVLHEVYSYGAGYRGLMDTLLSISEVLKPGGYFAYRDVYAVEGNSLHTPALHSYNRQGWLRFIKAFAPHYLAEATHPYHRMEDDLVFRQDSRRTGIQDINTAGDTLVSGPVGMFREIQRHYITMRDHAWRSGVLGFRPELEGRRSSDWIDVKAGHKRVHYSLTDSDLLSQGQRQLLIAMSEVEPEGHLVIDGDIFDHVTDGAINNLFGLIEAEDPEALNSWDEWMAREGSETYAYMTVDQLLGSAALISLEAGDGNNVMLPVRHGDVMCAPRTYYNRLLRRQLPNPLFDGKQMVLFQKTPLSRVEDIEAGLAVVQAYCSRETLANLFSVVNKAV